MSTAPEPDKFGSDPMIERINQIAEQKARELGLDKDPQEKPELPQDENLAEQFKRKLALKKLKLEVGPLHPTLLAFLPQLEREMPPRDRWALNRYQQYVLDSVVNPAEFGQFFIDMFDKDNFVRHCCFAASSGEIPLAIAALVFDMGRCTVDFDRLIVRQNCRRAGVGKRLVQNVMQDFFKIGATTFRIRTEQLPLQLFFKSLKFTGRCEDGQTVLERTIDTPFLEQ